MSLFKDNFSVDDKEDFLVRSAALREMIPKEEKKDPLEGLTPADEYYCLQEVVDVPVRDLYPDGEGQEWNWNKECLVGASEVDGVENRYLKRGVYERAFSDGSYPDYLMLQQRARFEEEWRYCPALTNLYQVSNYGRVRSRHKRATRRIRKSLLVQNTLQECRDYPWRILVPSATSRTLNYAVRLIDPDMVGAAAAGIVINPEYKRSLNADQRVGGLIGGNYSALQRADFLVLITFCTNEPLSQLQRIKKTEDLRRERVTAGELMSAVAEDLGFTEDVTKWSILHLFGNTWDCRVTSCRFIDKVDYARSVGSELKKRGSLVTRNGRKFVDLETANLIEEDLISSTYWMTKANRITELAKKHGVSLKTVKKIISDMKALNVEGKEAADSLRMLKEMDGVLPPVEEVDPLEEPAAIKGKIVHGDDNVVIRMLDDCSVCDFSEEFIDAAELMEKEEGVPVLAAKAIVLFQLNYQQKQIAQMLDRDPSIISRYLSSVGTLKDIKKDDRISGDSGGYEVDYESGYESGYE